MASRAVADKEENTDEMNNIIILEAEIEFYHGDRPCTCCDPKSGYIDRLLLI